ncbi:MAG: aldo/keto reductase, partial [Lentisphaeraceae bacterium]|nr:aldo/keto reductase [Lentisphaeraceae bacterium]
CGGMRYQHSWDDHKLSDIPNDGGQQNLEKTIKRALELGINHIETARGYGTSEIQLGQFLPNLPRDEMIIQTKVAPHAAPRQFEAKLELSFANLKLDHIDLFGFHGINLPEHLEWIENGCYEVVERWRRQGRIRHVGFSTHGLESLITKAIETDLFDYVNLHWYYFMQKNAPAVEAAAARDMGVFIISPSDKGGKLYAPPEKLTKLCEPLSPIMFNNIFCLTNPAVHTLSIGAARPSDFDEHLKVLAYLEQKHCVKNTEKKIEQALIDFHGERWIKNWSKNLPCLNNTPGYINLFEVLRLYTLATGLDMTEYGRMRYNLFGQKDHWFAGEKASHFPEQALLESLRSSELAMEIITSLKQAHLLLDDTNDR